MNNEQWLVIGGNGLLGRALAAKLEGAGEYVIRTMRKVEAPAQKTLGFSLADEISEWRLPSAVTTAFIAAGVASVSECRRHPSETAMINVEKTVQLAKHLTAQGTFVVFLSTNMVFDGSRPFTLESDPTSPKTAYGHQKAEAERALAGLGDGVAIVRMTKVLGENNSLFRGWIDSLRAGRALEAFSDAVLSPVSLQYATEALVGIARRRLHSVTHISGNEDISYHQAARHLAARVKASPELIRASLSKEKLPVPEHIPRHTTLDATRIRAELGMTPLDVRKTLDEVFNL